MKQNERYCLFFFVYGPNDDLTLNRSYISRSSKLKWECRLDGAVRVASGKYPDRRDGYLMAHRESQGLREPKSKPEGHQWINEVQS